MTERSLVVKSLSKPTVLSNMLGVDDEPIERFDDTDSCTRPRLLPRLPDLERDLERDRELALLDLDLDLDLDLEGLRERRLTTLRAFLLRDDDSASAISVIRRLKRPCEMYVRTRLRHSMRSSREVSVEIDIAQVSRNLFSTSGWQLRRVWRWCEWKQRQFSPLGHVFPYGHGDGTNSASPACMWVQVESSHSRLKQDDLVLDILVSTKV
jgi:hypothetical protein